MPRWLLAVASLLLAASALAQTTDNNSSCDISVTPAATLLLPYFEVDTNGGGTTTLFSVTNASPSPRIAHVTLWTDWAYPVLTFNLVLTGYDVQPVNLFDLLRDGQLPPPHCRNLPAQIPPDVLTMARSALTIGTGFPGCNGPVGGNHPGRAIGYVTVDVVSHCSSMIPADSAYFAGPAAPLRFDNVLLGDYQQIAPAPAGASAAPNFDAQGSSMVHIRAVPEGGLAGAEGGAAVSTSLPFTFYDRYTPAAARTADRRQPLPSTWAARFIQGGGQFATDFKIWREAVTAGLPGCSATGSVQNNSVIAMPSVIRFDEHENSTEFGPLAICCYPPNPSLPATSRTATWSFGIFPPHNSTDIGGWMYMNLSSGARHLTAGGNGFNCNATLSAQRPGFGGGCATAPPGTSGSRSLTQNWVTVSMYGATTTSVRLTVDFDAAWLGNGCTPPAVSP